MPALLKKLNRVRSTAPSLEFDASGRLYATAGDGASFNFTDWGQDGNPLNPCGDPPVPR